MTTATERAMKCMMQYSEWLGPIYLGTVSDIVVIAWSDGNRQSGVDLWNVEADKKVACLTDHEAFALSAMLEQR